MEGSFATNLLCAGAADQLYGAKCGRFDSLMALRGTPARFHVVTEMEENQLVRYGLVEYLSFCNLKHAKIALNLNVKLGKAARSRTKKKRLHATNFVFFNGMRFFVRRK